MPYSEYVNGKNHSPPVVSLRDSKVQRRVFGMDAQDGQDQRKIELLLEQHAELVARASRPCRAILGTGETPVLPVLPNTATIYCTQLYRIDEEDQKKQIAFILCMPFLFVFQSKITPSTAQKKAALRRVSAVRLGGGGNEACPILTEHADLKPAKVDQSRQRASGYCFGNFYCSIFSKSPGLVLPADRLRAALPVGTNRAPNICFSDQRPFSAAHFITTLSLLAKVVPEMKNFQNRENMAENQGSFDRVGFQLHRS